MLAGENPLFNFGLGLLSGDGGTFGEDLGRAMQFVDERKLASTRNELARQLLQARRKQQAEERLMGLLGGAGGENAEMLGLLGQIAPEKLTEGLLANMLPKAQTLESPIGKLFGDRSLAARAGNTAAVEAIDAAIQREIGGADLGKVLQVRDDVTRNSRDFLAAQSGFQKVKAAANSETPAGDMALIFGYMKVLDPSSVVREGEFATVQNSASVPEQIRGLYNRILRGERLTPEQRQDFLAQAHAQFVPLVEQQQRLVRDSQQFAERNQLRFEDIVPDFVMPILPEPIAVPERNVRTATGGLLNDIARDVGSLVNRNRRETIPPPPPGFTLDPE
jgi:hypothetical protein